MKVLDNSALNQVQSSFEPITNRLPCIVTYIHFVLRLNTVIKPSKGMKSNRLTVAKCSCQFDAALFLQAKNVVASKNECHQTASHQSLHSWQFQPGFITKTVRCCTSARTQNRWMIHLLEVGEKVSYFDASPLRNSRATNLARLFHCCSLNLQSNTSLVPSTILLPSKRIFTDNTHIAQPLQLLDPIEQLRYT